MKKISRRSIDGGDRAFQKNIFALSIAFNVSVIGLMTCRRK